MELLSLLEELSERPFNYDANLNYVKLLRNDTNGNPSDLRAARQAMHSLFPLSEDLWIEWLDDELAVFSNFVASSSSLPSSSSSPEENSVVDVQEKGLFLLDLFNLAVQDYLSIPLWVKYLTFVKDSVFPPRPTNDNEDDEDEDDSPLKPTGWLSLDLARPIFQSSLQATNHHFTQSHLPWTVYRDFETLVLLDSTSSTAATTTAAAAATKNSETKTAVDAVRRIHLSRLATPHATLDQTWQDYSSFETKHDPSGYEGRMKHASSIKAKSERESRKRETSERKLAETGGSAHGWLEMIEFWGGGCTSTGGKQLSQGDLFFVRTCWERAVKELWNDATVWERYIIFLMNKMRVTPVVMGVVNRAVRNCSWSGELWGHRLRIGEILGESEEELNDVFGRAYSFIIESKSVDQYVLLAKNRCGLFRRRVLEESGSLPARTALRSAHEEAIQIFRQGFPDVDDFRVEQEAIHDEIHLFNDIARARSIYDTLLLSHQTSAHLCVLISDFERHHGRDLNRSHWILKQGLQKQRKDEDRLIILSAMAAFEKECSSSSGGDESGGFYDVFGKVKGIEWSLVVQRQKAAKKQGWSFDYSAQQAQTQLVQSQEPQAMETMQQEDSSMVIDIDQHQNAESLKRELEQVSSPNRNAKKQKLKHTEDAMEVDVSEEEQQKSGASTTAAPVKKDFYVLNDSNAGNIIRLINVKPETDSTFFKTLFRTKAPPVDYYLKAQEDGTTDGFIEFSRAEDAVAAALKDTVKVFGVSVSIQRCIPAKKKWDDFDENAGETEAGAAEQKKIYVNSLDVGVDKPLLRQVFGHYGKIKEIRFVMRPSIAFAYIEFETGKSAERALELDGKSLPGFPGRKIGVAISDKSKTKKRIADPKELIVTNFTIATTKDDLHRLFEKFGKLKDIRLLLDQSGLPRGVGFVEFEDEASAKSALQLNGTELDGKFLGVAPSDPNVRGGSHSTHGPHGKQHDRDGGVQIPQQRDRPGLGHPGRGGRGGGGSGGGRGGKGTANQGGEAAKVTTAVTTSSFVPRTASRKPQLNVKPGTVAAVAGPSVTAVPQKNTDGVGSKTQDDFRKMLMKK
ncbi:hypothetical protein BDR26DRAFT_858805 [Obelidium mucronatum]|nr:hypothetical protein BDR26DRAFT_858805 [Obelidium mucronatum]